MQECQLYIGPKTQFFNLFRRLFTFPFFKNLLINQIKKAQVDFGLNWHHLSMCNEKAQAEHLLSTE